MTKHSQILSFNYMSLILTLSLALGAALVPILLSNQNLGVDAQYCLTFASIGYLLTASYLLVYMSKQTTYTAHLSLLSGIQERYDALRLRNMLSKALLEKNEKHFLEYNVESRKVAEAVVNSLPRQEGIGIEHRDDIALWCFFAVTSVALYPVVKMPILLYGFITGLALLVLAAKFYISSQKSRSVRDEFSYWNSRGIAEEAAFNQYVADLMAKSRHNQS
ncbi:hypothetical protein IPM09_03305 [Candidatus Saccharibacteria bacterium]|nr:MAG: hypothetical protein IPM09_03305 [Candidatus Saccharibacteria bacterium]